MDLLDLFRNELWVYFDIEIKRRHRKSVGFAKGEVEINRPLLVTSVRLIGKTIAPMDL